MSEEIPADGGPIVMKLKKKYLVKRPGNKGTNKKKNSGGVGRRARGPKRGVVVSGSLCPEQYGLWKAWMEKNSIPILG